MSLSMKITVTYGEHQTDTLTQDYTDSPFLETAIKRAQELIIDHTEWNVPDGVLWTAVSISFSVKRD